MNYNLKPSELHKGVLVPVNRLKKTGLLLDDLILNGIITTPLYNTALSRSFEPCVLEVGDEVTLSARIGNCKLSGSYDRQSERLNATDAGRLTADLLSAYHNLFESARLDNRSVQPLLIRYSYLDAAGNTLYMSPVKLLQASAIQPYLFPLSTTVNGDIRNGITATALAFSVIITLPSADIDMADIIKSVVVEAAPPVPVIDRTVKETENSIDINSGLLTCFMPGTSAGMAQHIQRLGQRITETLTAFDTMATPLMRIEDPFGLNAATTHTVPTISLSEGNFRIVPVMVPLEMQPFRLPHRFRARLFAQNGDTMLWASPVAMPWRGWDVTEWSVSVAKAEAWQACVIVEFADGQRAVWSGSGSENAPLQVTPLWHYPAETATAMELRVRTPHGTAIHRMSLKAVPGTGMAYAITHNTLPITLDYSLNADFSIPLHTVLEKEYPDILLCASNTDPYNARDAIIHGCGVVVACMPALAGASVWEFARHRFYIFSEKGTFMAITNAGHGFAALQLIDSKKVTDEGTIAHNYADGSIILLFPEGIFSLKGTTMKRITGTPHSFLTPLCCDSVAKSVTACHKGELWICYHDGLACVVPLSATDQAYMRSIPENIEACFTTPSGDFFLMTRSNEIWKPDCCRAEITQVRLSVTTESAAIQPKVCGSSQIAILPLTASKIVGDVKVYTHCESHHSQWCSIAGYHIDGAVKCRLRLPAPRNRDHLLTVTFDGTVSADAVVQL